MSLPTNHDGNPDSLNLSADSAWVLVPSSGLYWNSHQRIWAKPDDSQDGRWIYVNEEGHPVEASVMHSATAQHPRPVVVYEDVSDGEEGEVQATAEELASAEPNEPVRVPPLRLRVLEPHRTKSIPEGQSVLILDNQTPVTIGRDRAFGPSLRLKEMEISKTHLTLYSDPASDSNEGPGWFVIDNASTLGTFVSSKSNRASGAPVRLSKAKQASQPVRLFHLDTILISSATEPLVSFEVHFHPKFPTSCMDCALLNDESNRIRLTTDPASKARPRPANQLEGGGYAMTPQDAKANRERKRKTEMAKLRSQFFGESSDQRPRKRPAPAVTHEQGRGPLESDADPLEEQTPQPKYVDRAKLRRQTNAIQGSLQPATRPKPTKGAPQPVVTVPQEDPFGATSRGAALLAKVGGTAGSMGTVVEARTLGVSQAGLGSRALVIGVEKVARASLGSTDWREQTREVSRKRFQAL